MCKNFKKNKPTLVILTVKIAADFIIIFVPVSWRYIEFQLRDGTVQQTTLTTKHFFVILSTVSVISSVISICFYYKDTKNADNLKYYSYYFKRPLIYNRDTEQHLIESLKFDKGTGCEALDLDPFSKEILKFQQKAPKLICPGLSWVKCYTHRCGVIKEILRTRRVIKCIYHPLVYVDDAVYSIDRPTALFKNRYYKLTNSDHVKIHCRGIYKDTVETWEGLGTGFRTNISKKVPPGRENSYNVLIFGFDSVSHNGFIRNMPNSYEYLKKELNATFFKRYNIVGDGTSAAMFPIMTGKNELELPDFRKNIGVNNTADQIPLIFNKVSDDGYYTAYFEDMPWIGTFNWRFNGFKKAPADHYLRTFFKAERHKMMDLWKYGDNKRFCSGDMLRHELMIKLTERFLRLGGKRFCYTFIADITHDDFRMLANADDSTMQFLKSLNDVGIFKNTLLIFMGDHGLRYQSIRKTLQGKLEERLPLMAIVMPEELKHMRPEAFTNFRDNAAVLTTPYDIHSTILDVIGLNKYRNNYKIPGADLTRGMSLLDAIPKNRSCSEAGIEAHWCTCVRWENVTKDDELYDEVAIALVDYINSLTSEFRSICAVRTVKSIVWVLKQKLNKQFLSFEDMKDIDGFVIRNGNFEVTWIVFQVKVKVNPGPAFYEATLKYYVYDQEFHVEGKDISRTNEYGDESQCIVNKNMYLLPYCYCRDIDIVTNSQTNK